MELNQSLAELRKKGLALAAISYDSPAILKHFADRQKIGFPLLSDPGSKTIRAFGIFNESIPQSNPFHGVPHPVTFVVDRGGKVQSKYFEEDYRQRRTLAGLLARDYGIAPAAAAAKPEAKHIEIETAASTAIARSGQRIMLGVDIKIPKGVHLYAPGAGSYIAVDWKLAQTNLYDAFDVTFPAARRIHLAAINETLPVYEKSLRLGRDVRLAGDKELKAFIEGKTPLSIEGTLRYQACDERQCFPPETVPMKWMLNVEPHDRQRVPKQLQQLSR